MDQFPAGIYRQDVKFFDSKKQIFEVKVSFEKKNALKLW